MSTTVKFTISDDNYQELLAKANEKRLSIQDYIRLQLFPGQILFTPQDAITRALQTYKKGETFTVPEIYGEAWNLPNGVAGQFGKKFYALVEAEYPDRIRFTGNFSAKKHAIYEVM